jgi:hypothetical protein
MSNLLDDEAVTIPEAARTIRDTSLFSPVSNAAVLKKLAHIARTPNQIKLQKRRCEKYHHDDPAHGCSDLVSRNVVGLKEAADRTWDQVN